MSVKNNLKNSNFIYNKQKLYNASKSPFISIILIYDPLKFNDEKISNIIEIILSQSFIDIQLVIIYNSIDKIKGNKMTKRYRGITNIKFFISKSIFMINNIIEIINQINGKYIIILDKYLELKKDDIYKIFITTKGNFNNISKYSLNNKSYFYIIRLKILRDIFDLKIELNNFQGIIDYVQSYPLPKFNYIPISYCPNNKYTSLCYTSMLSILENKSIFSYIIFYIIIPKDFTEQNIMLLERLYEQYDYFNITFIFMDNRWKNSFTSSYLTIHAYYRYSLGELIPNFDKIIYLDADTICFGDLSNFYSLNFRGKVILGRLLETNYINNKEYYSINSGILLLNLKEMREIKFEKRLLKISKNRFPYNNIKQGNINNKYANDLRTVDQAFINKYFYKYIGLFPPKYNGKRYFSYNITIKYNKDSGGLYENDYLYFSFKFPSIRHYPGQKLNIFYNEDWAYYARKSKYFHKLSKNLSNIYNYLLY